jgi:hypothetical protein
MTTTTGFGPAELRYLKRLETALLVAPRRERGELLAVARGHIGERPPAGSYEELVEELGPPDAYCRQLMADHGVGPQPPRWRRVAAQARSREAIAVGALVVLVAGVGIWFLADWYREEPTITNNCAGAWSDDEAVSIEGIDAAGDHEHRIGYVDGAEVRILFCLTSSETIEVTAVEVPSGELGLFLQNEVLLQSLDEQHLEDALPFAPFTIVASDGTDDTPDPRVWWHLHPVGNLANCEHYAAGDTWSFDTVTLTYRFRGRTRTMPIDLLSTYAFETGSDEACPRRNAGVGS